MEKSVRKTQMIPNQGATGEGGERHAANDPPGMAGLVAAPGMGQWSKLEGTERLPFTTISKMNACGEGLLPTQSSTSALTYPWSYKLIPRHCRCNGKYP